MDAVVIHIIATPDGAKNSRRGWLIIRGGERLVFVDEKGKGKQALLDHDPSSAGYRQVDLHVTANEYRRLKRDHRPK